MRMVLANYILNFWHFVDQVRASLIPMSYPDSISLSISIGASTLKIGDHFEEGVHEDIISTLDEFRSLGTSCSEGDFRSVWVPDWSCRRYT